MAHPEIIAAIIAGSASIIAAIIATRNQKVVHQPIQARPSENFDQLPSDNRKLIRKGNLVLWLEAYLGIAILVTVFGAMSGMRFYDNLSLEAFIVFAIVLLGINLYLLRKRPVRVISMLLVIAVTFLIITSINALLNDGVLYFNDEWLALWTVSTTIVFIGTLILWFFFRKRRKA